jgi:hypothetical protein
MNIEELEEALKELMPGFQIETDNEGQLVVYTGLTEDEDGELLPIDEDDESSFDEETEQLEDDDPEDE